MIQLRPFTDADILLLDTWLDASHVQPWFADKEEWLNEVRSRDGDFKFIHHFIACDHGIPFGFCQYYRCGDAQEDDYRMFPPGTTYSIDYLVGETTHLQRGLGKRMISELLRIIRSSTEATLVVVHPDPDNLPSSRLLQASGFRFHQGTQILCLDI